MLDYYDETPLTICDMLIKKNLLVWFSNAFSSVRGTRFRSFLFYFKKVEITVSGRNILFTLSDKKYQFKVE